MNLPVDAAYHIRFVHVLPRMNLKNFSIGPQLSAAWIATQLGQPGAKFVTLKLHHRGRTYPEVAEARLRCDCFGWIGDWEIWLAMLIYHL